MGKASREKRQRRQRGAVRQMIVERVRRSMPDTPIAVLPPPAGPKVSDKLVNLAEPWLNEGLNDHQSKIVVGLAAMAWNLALLPEPERWNVKDPERTEIFHQARNILEAMIIRKRELFPDETRLILGHEVTGRGDNLRVSVVFSLTKEQMAVVKPGDQAALLKSSDPESSGTEV